MTFENQESAHEFVVVFHRKRVQESNQETNGAKHQESNQESVQESVQETNGVRHQVEHQVEHQVKHQDNGAKYSLSAKQKDIINFCSIPRTAKEIMDRFGVYNQSRSRKKYIQPLIEMGYLELTNPENPNASNQKYRKVRKG